MVIFSGGFLVMSYTIIDNSSYSSCSSNSTFRIILKLRRMPGKNLSPGEPCFAKVKGYIAYPAKIIGRAENMKKEKYSVVFYGTAETSIVEPGMIWLVTADTIKKFVTSSSLSRWKFKEGVEEMKAEHEEVKDLFCLADRSVGLASMVADKTTFMTTAGVSSPPEIIVENIDVEEDDEFDFTFMYSNKRAEEAIKILDAQKDLDESEDDLFDVGREGIVPQAVLESQETRTEVDRVDDGESDEVAPTTSKKKVKPVLKKTNKKKKAEPKKRGKTLREDQMELDKAFSDKIVGTDEDSYRCKDCPDFVTRVRLLARTHAQTCSMRKKKQSGRKAKKFKCGDCGIVCDGKMGLAKHYKDSHPTPAYNCSQCDKTFKLRKRYMNHLKIHEEGSRIKCLYCPKTFRFNSYMRRHIGRVHKPTDQPQPQNVYVDNGNDVKSDDEETIEVHLKESLATSGSGASWQMNVLVPSSDSGDTSSSDGTFFNTLGLNTREEWEEYWEVARLLPLSGGVEDSMEVAVVKAGDGKEEIIVAGSDSSHPLFDNVTLSMDNVTAFVDDLANELALMNTAGESHEDPQVQADHGQPDTAPVSTSNVIKKFNCPYCGEEGFRDAFNLKRHVDRVHLVPIKCMICDVTFVDKYNYLKHANNCFFICPRAECTFHTKKKSRFESHMRSHQRDS